MCARNAIDQTLLVITSGAEGLTSIRQMVGLMEEIQRALPKTDGLRWFNGLYLVVTANVLATPSSGWRNPEWLTALDVEFVKLYIRALRAWCTDPRTCPRAWTPLFRQRENRALSPAQLAFAGVGPHILRDLPIAVETTCRAFNITPGWGTPEHEDFLRVNRLLADLYRRGFRELTSDGLVRIALFWGKLLEIDEWSVMNAIKQARDLAWINALSRHHTRLPTTTNLDLAVGGLNRALLLARDELFIPGA